MIDKAGVLVREAVVILPPHVRAQQVIQRRDRLPPGQVPAFLQPLGMLVKHGIHNVDEGLIAGKVAVPAGEQVSLKPALTQVL